MQHCGGTANHHSRGEAQVDRGDVEEFHYITPVENLTSVLTYGLQSHERAKAYQHVSVASESVQGLRAPKHIPGQGRTIHDYVNLYFHCRNSMMFFLMRNDKRRLVVVRVRPSILDLPGAIIADGNAASHATRFMPVGAGLRSLDKDRVYARSWDHPDSFVKTELKRQRSAELLVPDQIAVSYITGYYVYKQQQIDYCSNLAPNWPCEVNADVFFE
ncbi:DUF4433 domain-containing protein [Actinokineospora pegani]|uniref:DUF4433 domain-containing protein n=1 Tax=Actinokineospora pegani TaxID=2654637 RepID=UPI0012EA999D